MKTITKQNAQGVLSAPGDSSPGGEREPKTLLVERRTWRRVRVSLVREQAERPYTVREPGDVVGLLRAFFRDDPRERFTVVYLDAVHRPIAVHDASTGTAESAPVHPREVFGPALTLSATAVILAHNHPSGDPTPSDQDRVVTKRLQAAGDLLGIKVLDHIIIGEAEHFSFTHGGRRWNS